MSGEFADSESEYDPTQAKSACVGHRAIIEGEQFSELFIPLLLFLFPELEREVCESLRRAIARVIDRGDRDGADGKHRSFAALRMTKL